MQACHLSLFIGVTAIGKISLNLVATTNACPHLIFPFQFFDFAFLYSFFSLRSIEYPVTSTWIAQQLLLQVNIVARNSGFTDAMTKRHVGRFYRLLSGGSASLSGNDHANDPLLRLQYLARLGLQYDLADVAALLVTPSIVTLFVWRDGFFSFDQAPFVVRACDLGRLWLRFGLLLVIKPAASTLARQILRRTMRRTLLGMRTMHGVSQLAAKIMAERALTGGKASDAKVQQAFATVYVEEELMAVRGELSLSGLNNKVLQARAMKKWRFYVAVILLQLFSAFSCRRFAPSLAAVSAVSNGTVAAAPLGRNPKRFHDLASLGLDAPPLNMSTLEYEPLPLSSVWYYVPPTFAVRTGQALWTSFVLEEAACRPDYRGWSSTNLTLVAGGPLPADAFFQ